MLNIRVLNIIGLIMIFLSFLMIPSSLWSIFYSLEYSLQDQEFFDFIAILKSALISFLSGFLLLLLTYKKKEK